MEKPKIVSVTDALESPDGDDGVPQLPGSVDLGPQSEPSAVPSRPELSVSHSLESEVHPEEVPPERVARASLPDASRSVEATTNAVVSQSPVPTPDAVVPPRKPESSEMPPWVDRNPPQPTVAEVASPVPSYPGVGRPRVNSISQGVVPLEPAKPLTAPIRPTAQPPVSSTPARPVAPVLSVPPSSGKLYERPELDADHFAEDMALHKPNSAGSTLSTPSLLSSAPANAVAQEYRSVAAADLKPPAAPARPRTPEEERAHAKMLAAQIHQDNQKAGFLGQIKRMFGLR